MKVVLHIGFHKTGTTALQSFLTENRDTLAGYGLNYPDFSKYDNDVNEKAHFFLANAIADQSHNIQHLQAFLEQESRGCQTLFISAESLIRHSLDIEKLTPRDRKLQYLKRLASVLPQADTEVVVSLRNPFKLIDSYHQENVKKTFYSGSFAQYVGNFFKEYDPISTLDVWQEVFPRISVRQYEADCNHEYGIVGAFMEVYAPEFKPEKPAQRLNTSLSTLSVEVLRRLNPYLKEAGGKARVLGVLQEYSQASFDEGRSTYWTDELLEVLQDKIQSDFAHIAEKYSIELNTSAPEEQNSGYFNQVAVVELLARLSKQVNYSLLRTLAAPLVPKATLRNFQMPVSEALSLSKPKTSRLGAEYKFQESKSWPAFTPEFTIDRSSKIFPIGSCFARNIEEYLVELKLNVPTAYFKAPKEEWSGRPSGILNKYSPTAIRQAIDWASDIYMRDDKLRKSDLESLTLEVKDQKVVDMQLASFAPVSNERHIERRKDLYKLYRHLFTSDVVTITLGMTETWKDQETGLYLDAAPVTREMLSEKGRFCFENLTTDKVAAELNCAIDAISQINPSAKFIITTSPVPMLRTFSNTSQTIANTYSKSTLRSACDLVLASQDKSRITYFPSYEIVTGSRSWDFWQKDLQHIKSGGVAQLVKFLAENMIPDLSDDERDRLASRAYSSRKEREVALSFAEAVAKRSNDKVDLQLVQTLKTSVGR